MPGFIKPVNGNMRMRFVQDGYDPDDYTTPHNKVIFDSDDVGTLAVIQTGKYTFGSGSTGNLPETKIASWSLGFVPLCYFQFDVNNYGIGNYAQASPGSGTPDRLIRVTNDGAYARLFKGAGTLDVYYTVYALAAA